MDDFSQRVTALARQFARDASHVDEADSLPEAHLEALGELGLYGVFAPVADGGLALDVAELCGVVEELAAACLATTFVWIQHFQLLAAALDPSGPESLRGQLSLIVRGDIKGGVALTGQMPGPPRLTATPTSRGWSLKGEAPWVSGWGVVDSLVVAARGPDDTVVTVLLEATDQPGLVVARHQLAALNASATVKLAFQSLDVGSDNALSHVAFDPTHERPEGLRVNGSLALGVARRCCELLGSSSLDDELTACRDELDRADGESIARARARACELATRAALVLSVRRGSSSVRRGDVAERTVREAALLLTFGSRPSIRQALTEELGATLHPHDN